jgi:hypothetical protein
MSVEHVHIKSFFLFCFFLLIKQLYKGSFPLTCRLYLNSGSFMLVVGLFEAYQAFGARIGGETGRTDAVKHIAFA